MGVLYLDESGNTGLWDDVQSNLIYGGPYVKADKWRELNSEIEAIQFKYKSIIQSRLSSMSTMTFRQVEQCLHFLTGFYIHSTDIVDRKGLWSKLDDTEKFQVIEDVIGAMIKCGVIFFIGRVDKKTIRPAKKEKVNKFTEYKMLIPKFLNFVDGFLSDNEDYQIILDDGDVPEKDVFRGTFSSSHFVGKCHGELILEKSAKMPILQAADVGVWVTQSALRLAPTRIDVHAKTVRTLKTKLSSITKELTLP